MRGLGKTSGRGPLASQHPETPGGRGSVGSEWRPGVNFSDHSALLQRPARARQSTGQQKVTHSSLPSVYKSGFHLRFGFRDKEVAGALQEAAAPSLECARGSAKACSILSSQGRALFPHKSEVFGLNPGSAPFHLCIQG